MKKSKSILMSPPMVTAILNGLKTQTRRIFKCPNGFNKSLDGFTMSFSDGGLAVKVEKGVVKSFVKCPYGKVGDILNVRETFYAYGVWLSNGLNKNGKESFRFDDWSSDGLNPFGYRYADNPPKEVEFKGGSVSYYKRPSLFMPSVAVRLRLEILEIKVERLHDISESDAIDEGIDSDNNLGFVDYMNKWNYFICASESYFSLWEKLNGKESLDQNPFVWAIKFKLL
jgi:hypothetical protein